MTTATVSIDRTSLSLSALVIGTDRAGTYVLLQDGLGRPGITARTTTMPDSVDIHGSETIAVVKQQSTLPLQILVQAATTSALEAAIDALDAALWQFAYPVTVTVDGVAKVWQSGPADWASTDGTFNESRVAQFCEVLTITIPVYPIAGA